MDLLTLITPSRAAATKGNVNTGFNAINAILEQGGATIVSSASPVTLTVDSSAQQWVSGSTAQDINLPDATTLYDTYELTFINNSSAVTTVYADDTSTVIATLNPSDIILLKLSSNATTNGTWEQAAFASGTIATSVNTNWTLADASGATLTFTSVTSKYSQVSNLYVVSTTFTYPTTASTAAASVSGLPIAPVQNWRGIVGFTTSGIAVVGYIAAGATSMAFYDISGTALQNVDLTGATLYLNNITYAA